MNFQLVSDDERKVRPNWLRIDAYTNRYKPGTPFDFSITRRVKKPSSPQRAYFWSVVMKCFCDAYFYERDEDELVHRHLKIKYFKVQPDKHGIYREKDIPSVFSDDSNVTPEDRKNYIDWVVRLCAQSPDNPVYVPEPGE